jgi:hypothetical protein
VLTLRWPLGDRKILMEKYDLLDINSETHVLCVEEKSRFYFISNDLRSFWILEKTKLNRGPWRDLF